MKGKGVSFMENQPGWHGKSPNRDELTKALDELGLAGRIPVDELLAKAKAWQAEATRALEARHAALLARLLVERRSGRDAGPDGAHAQGLRPRPCRMQAATSASSASVSTSPALSPSPTSTQATPERAPRWISMGIAEQSATAAAAGLAREGKLPVLGSYATFSAARNLDQLRVSICYSNLNVLVAGAHAGVSVGPDGATHQALEDLFAMLGLPNMTVVVPCDAIETRKATRYLLLEHVGPKYIRFAREATPIVTDESTPFVFGKANCIRLRPEQNADTSSTPSRRASLRTAPTSTKT